MEKGVDSLKSIGLTDSEAITYIDLRTNGTSQTGKICNRTKIPSSHIYSVLNKLLEKGLVNYKLINNIKVYSASEPEALAQLFEEKEEKIKQEKEHLLDFVSDLKAIPTGLQKLSDFKYFYGLRGIKSMFIEFSNLWKENDEYYVASSPSQAFDKLEGFFMDIIFKKIKEKKIKLKILVNADSKDYGEKRKKEPLTQVKYLNINTDTEYVVMDGCLLLINYSSRPYGLMIKDKDFASTYKIFFDLLWKQAKE